MELGGGWGKFLEDKPHSSSILEAQKFVRERLEKKHLPLFLLSKGFQARNVMRESISEGGDDQSVTKKRRAHTVQKVIEDAEQSFYKLLNRTVPDYSLVENVVFPPIRKQSISYRSSFMSATDVKGISTPLPYGKSKTSGDESPYVIVKVGSCSTVLSVG